MKTMMTRLTATLILSLCSNVLCLPLTAQSEQAQSALTLPKPRPVTSTLCLGIGGATVHDTYLTNQVYEGKSLNIDYHRNRLCSQRRWDNDQWASFSYTNSDDRTSEMTSMMTIRLRYHYAKHRTWTRQHSRDSSQSSTLRVGPYAGMNLGVNYGLSMASANNPVNVHSTMNLGLSAGYQWQFALRHRPARLSLQVQTPLLGNAFRQEYGASYYETLMLDDESDPSHFTSLHNQQDLDIRLGADLPVSALKWLQRFGSSLHIGMSYHIETMDINHLITRYSYCQLTIGWTWQYLPYKAPWL